MRYLATVPVTLHLEIESMASGDVTLVALAKAFTPGEEDPLAGAILKTLRLKRGEFAVAHTIGATLNGHPMLQAVEEKPADADVNSTKRA